MLDLYTAPVPNGHEVAILLEELGASYRVQALDLARGDTQRSSYLALNPAGRVPTLVDHDAGGLVVFESAAILLYLAGKYGRFLPAEAAARSRVVQWLMFQAAVLAPVQAQAHRHPRAADADPRAEAIESYRAETLRLYQALDRQLQGQSWLAGEYSIADMAMFPWVRVHHWAGLSIRDLSQLRTWLDRMAHRPAVQRGLQVPPPPAAPTVTPAVQVR